MRFIFSTLDVGTGGGAVVQAVRRVYARDATTLHGYDPLTEAGSVTFAAGVFDILVSTTANSYHERGTVGFDGITFGTGLYIGSPTGGYLYARQ